MSEVASPFRIAVTTGDPDGIGPEVTEKALFDLGPVSKVQFVVYCAPKSLPPTSKRLKKLFSAENLIFIEDASLAPQWVVTAGQGCFEKKYAAMVTAPLSKPLILKSGLKDIGHTDILKRIAKVDQAFMTFFGERFNVLLATGHHALKEIQNKLTPEQLTFALEQAIKVRALIDPRKRPIGVLGLNPHAGDQGLIGTEETEWIAPLIKTLNKKWQDSFVGPLVPDVAFQPQNHKHFSIYVALYHDQGLIPFKAVHGHDGVHFTAGLPFIRTSVDHGTAKDIAGQGIANSQSMLLALKWAVKLVKTERR